MKHYPGYSKCDPRFYPSKNKIPGSPLIFFVHFYGGHQKVLKRHIDLVNELGFDALAFNLPSFVKFKFSFSRERTFGMKHLYADMISFFLNQIEGPKIIYSFSNPGASALEAIHNRLSSHSDIAGLICDSGPSQAFLRSAWNLAIKVQKDPKLLFLFTAFWSWKLHRDLVDHIQSLPSHFPVLSIRGGQDIVIPPWHIEMAFSANKDLDLQVLDLPEAGHLDGLKRFPAPYNQGLSLFLSKFIPTPD